MSDALVKWLRHRFSLVQDVRRASTEPDSAVIFQHHQADLVVVTWMGARLYVYLVHKVPRTSDIRATLKENSRSGVGSLFILSHHLLPMDSTILRPTDWQEALFLLNEGWIYSYVIEGGQASLAQVHFSQSPVSSDYHVWQQKQFQIENVSVRQRTVYHVIKGLWAVGDIASPAYKRRINDERAKQRFHYSTKYTQGIPRSNGGAVAVQDELGKYYQVLHVDKDATEEQIKSAFRRMALQVHPDVSALPRSEANRRFQELNEAYEFIKGHHGWV